MLVVVQSTTESKECGKKEEEEEEGERDSVVITFVSVTTCEESRPLVGKFLSHIHRFIIFLPLSAHCSDDLVVFFFVPFLLNIWALFRDLGAFLETAFVSLDCAFPNVDALRIKSGKDTLQVAPRDVFHEERLAFYLAGHLADFTLLVVVKNLIEFSTQIFMTKCPRGRSTIMPVFAQQCRGGDSEQKQHPKAHR